MSFELRSDPDVMQSVEPTDSMTGKVSDRYVASLDTTSAGCAAAQHIFRVIDSRVSSPSDLTAPDLASNSWLCTARSVGIASQSPMTFPNLPNEILLQILGYLDVSDLLSISRVSIPQLYHVSLPYCDSLSFFSSRTQPPPHYFLTNVT